ncbi:hypothetical protein [Vogesella oryzae]|uniref:hypothetical protein n=1 Tax=Vogesella oryzae TaxID=1735285 RepID=UPI001582C6E7|nr:hypothetical protein [Vogesella oryzae]
MKTRTMLTVAGIAIITALSASAMAFGPGMDDGGKPRRAEMQAFRDAVMSGALTDAELATLKKDRDALHAQMEKLRADGTLSTEDRASLQKMRQTMHDKLQTLIANKDRTQPRSSWPTQLLPEPGRHGQPHGRGHDGAGGNWGSRDDMQAFHAAVQSGALTDAEIATLRQQQQALHAKLQELIGNSDRTQPRQMPAAPQP